MKQIRRIVAAAAMLVLTVCMIPPCAMAAFENTHTPTGDQAWDIVEVAQTQLGYMEGTLEGTSLRYDNYTKYGMWYDKNVQAGGFYRGAWCAMFVSWCANQAGIPSDTVYYHAYCPYGVTWYKERGLFRSSYHYGGSYVPKRGDIIYFRDGGAGASHVGLVRDCDGYKVYTIEGNSNNMEGTLAEEGGVHAKWYVLTSDYILGYATPRYSNASGTTAPKLGTYQMTAGGINYRTGPATTQTLVGQLNKNEVITVTAFDGEWGHLLRRDGTSGWTKIPKYATYIGQDLLAGTITASREHVRILTDAKGRVVMQNNGAAPVEVDLPVLTPIGNATTPYFNLSATPLYGQYSFAFIDDESGYTMRFDPACNKLVFANEVAPISVYRAIELCIRNQWVPTAKHQIDRMRVYLDAGSSVRFNIVYFSDEPGVVTTAAYNTRPYDGSDAAVPPANDNLLDAATLSVTDDTRYGAYVYDNGVLTVQSDEEDGYAVTTAPAVRFSPEAKHRLLVDVSADTDFDVELTVATADGERTVSLARDYAAALGSDGVWVAAGVYEGISLDLYTLLAPTLPSDGYLTVTTVTVRTNGRGQVTLNALQVNDTDEAIAFEDGVFRSEQTPAVLLTPGDLNADGALDMTDAFALYKAVSEGTAGDYALQAADVNADGMVDIVDAFALYTVAQGNHQS